MIAMMKFNMKKKLNSTRLYMSVIVLYLSNQPHDSLTSLDVPSFIKAENIRRVATDCRLSSILALSRQPSMYMQM